MDTIYEVAPTYSNRLAAAIASYTLAKDVGNFRTKEDIADVCRLYLQYGRYDFEYVFQQAKLRMQRSYLFNNQTFDEYWDKIGRNFVNGVIDLLENWQREGRK
jgi:hypothetical protein